LGYILYKKSAFSKKLAIFWNYLGLLVLASVIFVFMTSIYAPEMYGFTESQMPMEFTRYPYVLVAGFLMPSAVFVHVLSIVQLSKKTIE